MRVWTYLRTVAFSLVLVAPIPFVTGCGEGGGGGTAETPVTPDEDPTLFPETDSTLDDQ